jgi:hypothetical protein
VVLNRSDEELESNSYYQQRYHRPQNGLHGEEPLRLVDERKEEVAIAS